MLGRCGSFALVGLLAALFAVSALAGCGGGGGDEAGEAGKPTTVTVGVIPINPVAPVYLGIQKGFFKEENLNVKPQLSQGGAAIIPAVQSGDVQIGFSNSVSLMIAQSKGLPVRVIAQGETSPEQAKDDNSALMVTKDSPIRDPKDLEGKKIGVNTLQNIAGLTVEAALEKKGVDTSKLKFVEVPFPEMLSTLEKGEIDAGFFNEPFTTLAEQAGARTISNPYTETGPNMPIAPYFAMQSYIEENGDVIDRFARAMRKATQYAIDNPDEVRRIIPTFTETPAKVARQMGLPHLGTELDRERYQVMAGLVTKFGYVEDGEPNVDELVRTQE